MRPVCPRLSWRCPALGLQLRPLAHTGTHYGENCSNLLHLDPSRPRVCFSCDRLPPCVAPGPPVPDCPAVACSSAPPSLGVGAILGKVRARDPHQAEFLQAVEEVLRSLTPVLDKHPE